MKGATKFILFLLVGDCAKQRQVESVERLETGVLLNKLGKKIHVSVFPLFGLEHATGTTDQTREKKTEE